MTPDLVISQYGLGRSDGATFIQAIRGTARRRSHPRRAARHAPSPEPAGRSPRRRRGGLRDRADRATRFVTKLAKIAASPAIVASLAIRGASRRGLQARRAPASPPRSAAGASSSPPPRRSTSAARRAAKSRLPELHRKLSFVGEVLYRSELQGVDRQGIGVRIREISPEHEAALIAYVALRARQA